MNEAQALTIEAGKCYWTRAGHKAIVLTRNPFNDGKKRNEVFIGAIEYPDEFYLSEDCPEAATTWGDSGNFYIDHETSPYDLVAEWAEPKRVDVWVNIFATKEREDYPSGYRVGCVTHATKADAQRHAVGMVATVNINVLEGEGLNGEAA